MAYPFFADRFAPERQSLSLELRQHAPLHCRLIVFLAGNHGFLGRFMLFPSWAGRPKGKARFQFLNTERCLGRVRLGEQIVFQVVWRRTRREPGLFHMAFVLKHYSFLYR
jgi:hypothetical protein